MEQRPCEFWGKLLTHWNMGRYVETYCPEGLRLWTHECNFCDYVAHEKQALLRHQSTTLCERPEG